MGLLRSVSSSIVISALKVASIAVSQGHKAPAYDGDNILSALSVASLGVLIPSACAGQDAEPVTPIKRIVKAGDKAHYKLTMQIERGGQPGHDISVLEKFGVETTEAAGDGSWSQVTKFDITTVTMAGKDIDVLATMPVITISRSTKGAGQFAGGPANVSLEVTLAAE